MILKAEIKTVGDKTVISGLRWYASDWYGLLIRSVVIVGGVCCDFSQTVLSVHVSVLIILRNSDHGTSAFYSRQYFIQY